MNIRSSAMTDAPPVRIPPMGLAAALLLWGIANQTSPYALLMALVFIPTLGAHIFQGSTSPLLQAARTVILTHHERYDGTGYPQPAEK